MLTFLFWNFKSDNGSVLAGVVREHSVDVLILAECPISSGTVLTELNRPAAEYYLVQAECRKLQVYTRFSDQHVFPVMATCGPIIRDDYTFRRLTYRPDLEILLCAVHFPSKLYRSAVDQTRYVSRFADDLAVAEQIVGHDRTILIGDLNLNPYEDGLVSADGLHAVPTRHLALKVPRTVDKAPSNAYFYNPMWSHFGEKDTKHAGTYYYSSPKVRADFWNVYDQVLVRPSLLPYFQDRDVAVLSRFVTGNVLLVSPTGVPELSDHLPLVFRLNI